ncbi:hypothetical protein A5320_13760 [Rheinheimera sp. SA_1]|jgi:hypothetical protein|uniref:hypothetical protein n=1 Tax=Rheinheimera sp. SA_1 TaxID=1827365 RepID=UPI000800B0FD|nr:hypothetical protein [Rheinheimera sp. SA_1]OBP14784.1 hypothetical protein A5320_13760 [Rheinheimera sp. SA_1]
MNYYSGFLLGLMLICSSLFYGLALTNNDKKYQPVSSVLDGTWRLVSTRILTLDGKLLSEKDSTQLQSIKVVANQHFSFVSKTTTGELLQAAAGTFELVKNRYSESVELSAVAETQKQQHYEWRLEQGLWYQRSEAQQQVVEQVWQLVEAI